MKKEKTLLIMAAGMGSRFGGLKQIEPVGPNGEFIIDYSIYDALKAGFHKVVFIIKKENFEVFKETIGKRIEGKIEVDYAFQDLNDLPEGFSLPEGREKPWGTSHAILAAKNYISEPFMIINSDDFYGRDAFLTAAKFLDDYSSKETNEFAVITYAVTNTLTENGSVKRGVCELEGKELGEIIESSIQKMDGKIVASPLDGSEPFEIEDDKPVSMNMFAFTPKVFTYLEENFPKFLDQNKDNPLKCEYLIPESVSDMMREQYAKVYAIKTTARWQGVTYKEDKPIVVREIQKLIDDKIYPENLWEK